MSIIYISGKITGDPEYRAKFQAAADKINAPDIALLSSVLPAGMRPVDYMRICFAMIDTADCVRFLPDFTRSAGSQLELQYCQYIGKPVFFEPPAYNAPTIAEPPVEEPPAEEPHEGNPVPPAESTPVPVLAPKQPEKIRPYSGFVFLRCPSCGKDHAFCIKTPMSECTCSDCGTTWPLPPATPAFTECECGNHARYLTNITDWCFDIPCISCGSPCSVEYSPAKNLYVPRGQRGSRKARKHHGQALDS